jgi:vitamin B12 transporter
MCFDKLFLITVFVSFFLSSSAFSQFDEISVYDDDVIVTTSRIPVTYNNVSRSVAVISREDIASAPVQSIQQLLSYAIGVDVRQRGVNGIQSDISIRGASFEQTLILVDGMKVTDPQTGHHNNDLAISLEDIDRIEILRGSGSKLYGPNAMGGVINIITRQDHRTNGRFQSAVGQNGLFEQSISASLVTGHLSQKALFEKRNSTGYRSNTEFDINTFSYSAGLDTRSGRYNLSVSFTDKEFGANSFYSDRFPDQWESTKTIFLSAGADLRSSRMMFSPRIFWRQHDDEFILDRSRPDWYKNNHTTDHYGTDFQISLESPFGTSSVGGELAGEEIESSNLGDHSRTRGGVFVEQCVITNNGFSIIPGFSIYNYTDWGWKIYPGLDLGYRLNTNSRIYLSANQSFRVPTYTELYYQDPANLGNRDLRPEKAWTYEAGMITESNFFNISFATFIRKGDDMIDWAREDSSQAWQVLNITNLTTLGFEIDGTFAFGKLFNTRILEKITAQYAYLDSDQDFQDYDSKYILNHLKHQLILSLDQSWLSSLNQNWKLRYIKRLNDEDHFIVDTRLSWKYRNFEFFASATNLFNVSYNEISSIPMPGRWIRAGLNFKLFTK